MPETLRISEVTDLVEVLRQADQDGRRLEVRGGGSKARHGGWRSLYDVLDVSGLAGVIDYDPAELVLTARAGTPLHEIEALIGAQGQVLAFEPMDYATVLNAPPGRATLGGAIAAAAAGPRRVSHGGARDHLLGFSAVSGVGEVFKAGGRVVKNVTGFDLSKLMAGSWGALAVMTEVTLKVAPAGRETLTLALHGLTPEAAVAAMGAALRSPTEVSGAAHAPAWATGGGAITALRLEGFGPSVAARAMALGSILAEFQTCEPLPDGGVAFWRDLRQGARLAGQDLLWRVVLPPSEGALFAAEAERAGGRWLMDWGGGLIWVLAPAADPLDSVVRPAAERLGGHATLVRAGDGPAAVAPFPQEPPGVARLSARVKQAFDPRGVLVDRRAAREPA